jgi:energy coupling factor transporter S component ThiW
MIGAALSGILYKKTHHILGAVIGEIIGTGILGALAAFPVAKYLIGSQIGAAFFVAPFLISTTGGSVIAYLLYHTPVIVFFREKMGTIAR